MEMETSKDLEKIKDLKGATPESLLASATPESRQAFLYIQAECIATDDPGLKEK